MYRLGCTLVEAHESAYLYELFDQLTKKPLGYIIRKARTTVDPETDEVRAKVSDMFVVTLNPMHIEEDKLIKDKKNMGHVLKELNDEIFSGEMVANSYNYEKVLDELEFLEVK